MVWTSHKAFNETLENVPIKNNDQLAFTLCSGPKRNFIQNIFRKAK